MAALASADLEAWLASYDARRALADEQPQLLEIHHPQFHSALDAETVNVTQTQMVSAAERSAWDSVLTAWMPQQFRGFLGPARSGDLALEVDREEQPGSLASAMDLLRDKVDNYFGWSKKCLDKSWLAKRGAAQATMLILDVCADDARSELLQTKVFTLLLGERYRSHADVLFKYTQGAWQTAGGGSISAPDLEFLILSLRRAQAYFWAMGRNEVSRDFDTVAWELRVMPGVAFSDCCLARLLPLFSLFQLPCFLTTAGGHVTQAKKDPRHGCYIYVPVSLAWTATDHDRRRMVEREFQQQGHNFFQCVMLTFDEVRPGQGLLEDVFKVFVGGGYMPLRRNHEAETRYASWEYCAKAWLMNSGDIPHVPTAMETSHARRFRCTFLRNTLTYESGEVSIKDRIFAADADAKSFCSSPSAVWVFYHDWLFPYMTRRTPSQWYEALAHVATGSQTAKDTDWLLRRLARVTDTSSPDEQPEGPKNSCGSAAAAAAERLVREAHSLVTTAFFAPSAINRVAADYNPGVGARSKGSTKKLRVEYLQEAIQKWPHLIRQCSAVAGKQLKFQRRSVDPVAMDLALQLEDDGPEAVFGTWAEWTWPTDLTGEPIADIFYEGEDAKAWPDARTDWRVACHVDLSRLEAYAASRQDCRQDQVEQFLQHVQRHGRPDTSGHVAIDHAP
ncbi:unnamed protein product [Symbiodinium necroappetens]|uniref:Uncharacterized protein n=1 Tax=Symbiodinium necroappetens TaxID=1628268 RepID=A0A812NNY6_9DINO|nr:unnamed protein product [Symbiodinium necroappetens]